MYVLCLCMLEVYDPCFHFDFTGDDGKEIGMSLRRDFGLLDGVETVID